MGAGLWQNRLVNPALTQRLVTFHSYFWGFLILDRQSFFGDPPSAMETFVMALALAVLVTLLSPMVARLLPKQSSGRRRGKGDGVARYPVSPDLGI